jgi:Zn-dependent M28 family amino/carboxypeptidase
MRHLRTLVGVGVRQAGSDAEKRAADYVMSQLRAMGLEPIEQTFQLPDGRQSRNVICLVEGESDTRVILGAHIDSKAPSPGANDNASGAALLLELARVLAARPAHAAVELDFFGAEEVSDSDPNHHHAGSRARAARLSSAEIAQLAGMVSVDMVGYGQSAHVRTMGRGPRTLADALIAYGRRSNLRITYLLDPGETGWSDHEAFELLGIPSAWFEWRRDATTHTAADSYARQQPRVMRSSGRLLEGWVRSLNGTGLDALVR